MAWKKLVLSLNQMNSRLKDLFAKVRLPKISQQHPVAFSIAVGLHIVLLIALLFSNVGNIEQKPIEQFKKNASRTIPKAVTVDLSEIKKEKQRLVNNQKKKQAELKRKKRRLRELEDQRYQKQRKINKLKAKAKKEKEAKALAEKNRKIAEQKAKAAEKKKQAIEKQRKAEAKKFKEEQKKRALAKAAELKAAQKIKAEQQRILDELKVNYIAQIASKVHRQWRYGDAENDWSCVVDIVQDKGGNVQKVAVSTCNVEKSKKASFVNSIRRAVNKASPLPAPPDASIFDPNIKFIFKVNE